MARKLEEIIIINSNTSEDYLPFFVRYVGDQGRDIAAIKEAMGEIYQIQPSEEPISLEDNTLGRPWFSCEDNRPVSSDKARTFDKKLKLKVMAYQISNQLIMMSYYFETYCVRNIKDEQTLQNLITICSSMFETEFGSIGEATIACLHGWRPNSILGNQSFTTDTEIAIDQLPIEFLNLLNTGIVETPSDRVLLRAVSFTQQPLIFSELAEKFARTTHSSKQILNVLPERSVCYLEYVPVSYIGNLIDSPLFASAQNVMNSSIEKDEFEIKTKDRYKVLAPMLEPDPLTDPAPFELGSRKIGFFDRTEFTLENLPNFQEVPLELRVLLEDIAFYKILLHYKKSVIWEMSKDILESDVLQFSGDDARNRYQETLNNNQPYRITTRAAISELSLEEDQYDAIYADDLVSINGHRFIEFIEYRTPSLRPGDVYRAYFETGYDFLDKISTGSTERSLNNVTSEPRSIVDRSSELITGLQKAVNAAYCAEGATTEEEALIKFEQYKAFAMKKKLELSRQLRGAALQAQTGEDVSVDLGVFGNIPFLDVLDGSSLTAEDLVGGAFDFVAELANNVFSPQPSPDTVRLPVKTFREAVTALERIFRSDKVNEDIRKYKVINGDQQPLNLHLEADNLAAVPGYIEDLAFTNEDLIRASNNDVAGLLEAEGSVFSEFGTTMAATNVEIVFSGTEIYEIWITNRRRTNPVNVAIYRNDPDYVPLSGAMSLPRTVNYIRNINNMLPLPPDNFLAYVEDIIGLNSSPCSDDADSPSVGAALILRYTIHNSGTKVNFEPQLSLEENFHDWKENYLQREEIKRLRKYFEQVTSEKTKKVKWGADTILPEIGPTCDLKELYRDVVGKKNLAKLLCNYLSCLKIPNVNIKAPNLMLPEFPDIPIFQYPGLDKIVEQILEALEAVLTRVICAFVKNLFDILSSPFCEDQLVSDLFGSAGGAPEIQRAFASAFLDVGIPRDKMPAANNMIDDLTKFLTPRELCALLQGEPVNGQVYPIIENLEINGIKKQSLV